MPHPAAQMSPRGERYPRRVLVTWHGPEMQPVEQVFDAIRALTPVERLRLVERVVHSVAKEASPPAAEADTYADIVEEGGLLVATARAPLAADALDHRVARDERLGTELLLTFNLAHFVRLQGQATPRIVSPSEAAPTA